MKKFVHPICAMALLMCAAFGAFADTGQTSFDCEVSQSVEIESLELQVVTPVQVSIRENEPVKQSSKYTVSEPTLALNTFTDSPLERYDKLVSSTL